MALLLAIGGLFWDRPVRLSGPLTGGARLRGVSLGGDLRGRLGGAAANAAVAWARAGHRAFVAGVMAGGDEGEAVLDAARRAGLDLSLVSRRPMEQAGRTLILIEPDGERVVLGLDGPDPAEVGPLPPMPAPGDPPSLRPDGVFARFGYPGARAWMEACAGPVVAHWPWRGETPADADVLVGSAADLDPAGLADPLVAARAVASGRLEWAVVTRGAGGATAYAAGAEIQAAAPPADRVDATGAGDIFGAGLLEALVAGADMEAALFHACAWGAAAVGLDASAPVDAPAGTFRPFR